MGNDVDIGYLTVQQAADFLGVNRSAIYQAIESGGLVAVRVMGKRALRRADLETYREREGRNRIRAKQRRGEP